MWKVLVAAAIVLSLGEAQRSSYAPRRGSASKLLPRFRKNDTDAGLGTREGQGTPELKESTSPPTLPPELQGTLEDHIFVQRVSQWPEDRQPFWFKNRYAISLTRSRNIDGGDVDRPNFQNQRPRPQFQSSFQGSSTGRRRGNGKEDAQFIPNDTSDFVNDPTKST